MVGIIIGVLVVGIGVLLVFRRRATQDKLLEIKATQTSTAAELAEMSAAIKAELGAGGFKQQAEVKGMVRCDQPLTSELAKQPCVYYAMQVEERWEETYWEKDAQGNNQRRTRTGTTTVASNTQSRTFLVEDPSGRVAVNPNGAAIDAVQVLSQYQPYANVTNLSLGGFSFNVTRPSGDRRILGHQFTEKIIPLDRPIYVLGEASDTSGGLTIQQPSEKGKPFIVTLKSEEELTRSTESAIKWLMVGAVACFAIGAGLIAYGVLQLGK